MSKRTHNLSYLGAIAVSLVIAGPISASFFRTKSPIGFLILVIAPFLSVLAVTFSQTQTTSSDDKEAVPRESRTSSRRKLAFAAFFVAILFGLVLGLIGAHYAHPMDKKDVFVQMTVLASIAGGIVSLALLVSDSGPEK